MSRFDPLFALAASLAAIVEAALLSVPAASSQSVDQIVADFFTLTCRSSDVAAMMSVCSISMTATRQASQVEWLSATGSSGSAAPKMRKTLRGTGSVIRASSTDGLTCFGQTSAKSSTVQISIRHSSCSSVPRAWMEEMWNCGQFRSEPGQGVSICCFPVTRLMV